MACRPSVARSNQPGIPRTHCAAFENTPVVPAEDARARVPCPPAETLHPALCEDCGRWNVSKNRADPAKTVAGFGDHHRRCERAEHRNRKSLFEWTREV